MKNTYIIGKHFDIKPVYKLKKCCMCGNINPCIDKKEVIKASFMDHEYISDGNYICVYCAACIGYKMSQSEALRTTNFLATNKKFIRLKKHEIWNFILKPPSVPYVLAITFSHKKHIAFKSIISPPNKRYLSTDKGNVIIEYDKKVIEIMQNWYQICKDNKQEPTYFTKNDILFGCSNHNKIDLYGSNKYFHENSILDKFRGTDSLNLLTYLINKKEIK